MLKKAMSMLSWIVVFQLIGFLMGFVTQRDIATWYPTLHKSMLTPPAFVFPIAWSILYVMLAIAGWLLWQQRDDVRAKIGFGFFSAQMLLNWAWSPLFFSAHLIQWSFYCIVAMLILTLMTMSLTRQRFKLTCILLIPYFIWILFAAYLNAVIMLHN